MTMRMNHVRVDPQHPQAQGICDRCGFRFNLRDLDWQYEWAGEAIINLRLLVCDVCRDRPNENLRAYNPGPDPLPVQNPRFENADME